MTKLSPVRHVAKAITWRIIGSLDTVLLGYLLTSDFEIGLKVGGTEFLTKIVLYFVHERIWYRFRHILKTITWRFVGTMDTMFLAWFISGKAEVGLSIGGLELFTKMLLYYLHERVWYKINFGKVN